MKKVNFIPIIIIPLVVIFLTISVYANQTTLKENKITDRSILILEELYVEWEKSFGGELNDRANDIIQTKDGSYVIAGTANIRSHRSSDVLIIKLDQEGNILWSKTIAKNKQNYANAIIQSDDGNYYVVGGTLTKGPGKWDPSYWCAWLIKLNEEGDILWDKTFGEEISHQASSIIQTTDGGYAIAGTRSKARKDDAWILKIDAQGNLEWEKTFCGKDKYDGYQASSIIQTTDGGYAIAGANVKFFSPVTWLLKIIKNR